MSVTLGELLASATAELKRAGIEDPARDARVLVALAAGLAPDRLNLVLRDPADPQVATRLEQLLAKRAARHPISHITGQRAFFRHDFHVNPDVLDPRPETETLVEAALSGDFAHVLDLGTGSGCILLSLLAERPGASGIGTDLSAAALDVARRNAARLGVADRCLFLNAGWFDGVEGRFDLIVSNPPYIAADEMPALAPELAHEPRLALTDEADGLSAYRAIVPRARAHLKPAARLLVEIGCGQGPQVAAMFKAAGFEKVVVLTDLDGRDRVVSGESPSGYP